MNFFKKLFSPKKETDAKPKEEFNFQGIMTNEYFDKRYKKTPIDAEMLDGCLKMIEGYFIDNKIVKKIENPINHPKNLDQVDREGLGFILYCNAFQIPESQAILFIAYAFSDFLIKKYGFVLYSDSQPEYPLRGMTLRYKKDEVSLSLYPFEYAVKVLKENSSFSELEERIDSQLGNMQDLQNVVDEFIKPSDGDNQ